MLWQDDRENDQTSKAAIAGAAGSGLAAGLAIAGVIQHNPELLTASATAAGVLGIGTAWLLVWPHQEQNLTPVIAIDWLRDVRAGNLSAARDGRSFTTG